jgi:hypothetical protein
MEITISSRLRPKNKVRFIHISKEVVKFICEKSGWNPDHVYVGSNSPYTAHRIHITINGQEPSNQKFNIVNGHYGFANGQEFIQYMEGFYSAISFE